MDMLNPFCGIDRDPRGVVRLTICNAGSLNILGSAVIDLPRAFLTVAREVHGGTFSPRVESFGLKSGVIRYESNPALDGTVPATVKKRLKAAADSIVARDSVAP